MRARKEQFPFLSLTKPWRGNPNSIWLASTLSLHRNLDKYRFPTKLDTQTKSQIRDLITSQVKEMPEFKGAYLTCAEDMGALEKEFLYEHFLSYRNFQQTSPGEGFVLDNKGVLLAALNLDDHLRLQLTDTSENLEEGWNYLIKLETALGRTLKYAYTPRFGFLTANPMVCGTGTKVSLYLHLPALIQINSLQETVESLEQGEVKGASIQGSLEDIVGDILVLQNQCTIGLSGEDIIQSLRTQALKLIVAEKRIREEIKKMDNIAIKDKVARAFGLLQHSYQLEIHEAWGAISLVKLGLDLSWIKGTTQGALNELFFTTRRAHLICEYTEDIEQEEVARKRAEYLHATLRDIHLEI